MRTRAPILGTRIRISGIGLALLMLAAILGFMTTFGMTSETLIKWHEIGVTPEQSDRLGLIILGIGIVTVVAGRLLAKAGRRG